MHINSDSTIAYIGNGPDGFLIVDISNKSNPILISKTHLDFESCEGLAITKNEEIAIVPTRAYGFFFINIKDK